MTGETNAAPPSASLSSQGAEDLEPDPQLSSPPEAAVVGATSQLSALLMASPASMTVANGMFSPVPLSSSPSTSSGRALLDSFLVVPLSEGTLRTRMLGIYHGLLQLFDSVLYEHLQTQMVIPQLYLLKWLRLLLAREFSVNQAMRVWDLLFKDGLEMVDYLCVAMHSLFRLELLELEGPYLMQRLMETQAVSTRQVGEMLKMAKGLKCGTIRTLVVPSSVLYRDASTPYQLFMNEYWNRRLLEPEHYREVDVQKVQSVLWAGRKLWQSHYLKHPTRLSRYLAREDWD